MPTPHPRRPASRRPPHRATPPVAAPVGARPSGPGRHRRPGGRRPEALLTGLAALALVLAGIGAVVLTREPPTGPVSDAGPVTGLPTTSPTPGFPTASPPDRSAASTDGPSTDDRPTPRGEPPVPRQPTREPDPGRGGDRSGPGESLTAMEAEVTELTNSERAAVGCGPLRVDDRLHRAAREHSEDMAAHDYFSHTGRDGRSPFDRMRDAGYPDPAAENIASGYPTAARVVAGWMGSEGHRRNLLNCQHRTTGVGLAYDERGRPYWTQVFGR